MSTSMAELVERHGWGNVTVLLQATHPLPQGYGYSPQYGGGIGIRPPFGEPIPIEDVRHLREILRALAPPPTGDAITGFETLQRVLGVFTWDAARAALHAWIAVRVPGEADNIAVTAYGLTPGGASCMRTIEWASFPTDFVFYGVAIEHAPTGTIVLLANGASLAETLERFVANVRGVPPKITETS